MEFLYKTFLFGDFRSKRNSLEWLTQTRTDVCATSNILSQVTPDTFHDVHVTKINQVIRHVKSTADLKLRNAPLNEDSLHFIAFSDASYANNHYLSSQIGILIVLSDATGAANMTHYNSYKSKGIFRSVLGGDIYAFADAFLSLIHI